MDCKIYDKAKEIMEHMDKTHKRINMLKQMKDKYEENGDYKLTLTDNYGGMYILDCSYIPDISHVLAYLLEEEYSTLNILENSFKEL